MPILHLLGTCLINQIKFGRCTHERIKNKSELVRDTQGMIDSEFVRDTRGMIQSELDTSCLV